jgi:hypothetical protein
MPVAKSVPRMACACGCGQLASRGKRFVYTHHLGSGERNTHWKGGVATDGAGHVMVRNPDMSGKKYVLRSHLVAQAMVGRQVRLGENVHHLNGDKTDDRPDNLVVLTTAEHLAAHRAQNPDRYRSPIRSKLNADVVRAMRARRTEGESVASIARSVGVAHPTAADAICGRTWAHI